jgi:general secretion pathway protein K
MIHHPGPGRGGERGAALVVTLIFTAAMAAAAVAFLAGRRTDALTMRAQVQAVEAQAMLEAALQQTVALLVNRSGRRPIPDELSWSFGGAAVRVRLESEAGKVDLNAAEEPMLRGLPLALGIDEDGAAALAAAILDWRDDNQLRRDGGAEDREYGGADRGTSGAADRPFANPAELRYLLPVDRAAWELMAPFLTVYSGAAEPEPRRARTEVRQAMAIARDLAPASADEPEPGASSAEAETEPETGAARGERATGDARAGGSSLRAGELPAGTGPRSSLSPRESPAERRGGGALGEGDAGQAPGENPDGAEGAIGVQTLLLDVKFPNGYEAAAKAVVGLDGGANSTSSTNGADQPPFVVLDWTPVVRPRRE